LARMDVETFWRKHKGCGVDDPDCRDLLSQMMAYKAYNRPSIDEVLKHPWVTGEKAKVYAPKELKRVLRERHRNTRIRRRRDKKKMKDMQHSIKKRVLTEMADISEFPPCPVIDIRDYVPTFMSFIAMAEHLPEAYWMARNVCDLAFENKTYTTTAISPWTFVVAIKVVYESEMVREFLIQVNIVELQGLQKYSFTFKRMQGDPLGFRKIWAQIETLVLTKRTVDGKYLLFQDTDGFEDVNDHKQSEDKELHSKKLVGADRKKLKSVIV